MNKGDETNNASSKVPLSLWRLSFFFLFSFFYPSIDAKENQVFFVSVPFFSLFFLKVCCHLAPSTFLEGNINSIPSCSDRVVKLTCKIVAVYTRSAISALGVPRLLSITEDGGLCSTLAQI